ncbi:hypothetical protein [Nonomuraea typhae]|uniref:hypothetical protein n=1 Tax=Nonomuraea typhae TaxID=2603600 RepID=UPI0012F94CA9|nr:hypothetical protein [Nonomuraea typhae]
MWSELCDGIERDFRSGDVALPIVDIRFMDWATIVSASIGTVIGGAVSIFTTWLTLRRQAAIERGRRADDRERQAVVQAREALARLIRLPDKPSDRLTVQLLGNQISFEDYHDELTGFEDLDFAWSEERDGVLLDLQLAIDDIGDAAVWGELDQARRLLSLADFHWDVILDSESRTRQAACLYARECLRSLSIGMPVPPRNKAFASALSAIGAWEEDQARFAKAMAEERRLKRPTRQAPAQQA